MLDSNGELDRKNLGTLIFNNPARRRQLESILHPRVRDHSRALFNELEQAGNRIAVYESALLFETQRHTEMRGVILVTASEEQRISRVQARDGSDEEEVRKRIRAQMDEAEKRNLSDYILENNGDIQVLRSNVNSLISKLLQQEQEG